MYGRFAGILVIVLLVGPVASQVKDGDVVMATGDRISVVDPASGRVSLLVAVPSTAVATHVRMASNNRDLLALASSGAVVEISPTGVPRLVAVAPAHWPMSMELDHDGRWVIASNTNGIASLLTLDDSSGRFVTEFHFNTIRDFRDLTIDRDSLSLPYAIVGRGTMLYRCDRRGTVVTVGIFWPLDLDALELHPVTGEYLVCARRSPSSVALVDRQGRLRTVTTAIPYPVAARFNPDGTAWIASFAGTRPLARIDMQGRVLQMLVAPPGTPGAIEIYGSRRLTCRGTGTPGTSIQISLKSARPGDAHRPYQLAASFFRTWGLKLPNGEWLNLRPDMLFLLSTVGTLPHVFQHFGGVTDSSGAATARINLPAALPPGLNVPVYVAGVIYDSSGIRTVTNTHWCVLN